MGKMDRFKVRSKTRSAESPAGGKTGTDHNLFLKQYWGVLGDTEGDIGASMRAAGWSEATSKMGRAGLPKHLRDIIEGKTPDMSPEEHKQLAESYTREEKQKILEGTLLTLGMSGNVQAAKAALDTRGIDGMADGTQEQEALSPEECRRIVQIAADMQPLFDKLTKMHDLETWEARLKAREAELETREKSLPKPKPPDLEFVPPERSAGPESYLRGSRSTIPIDPSTGERV